MAGCILTSLIFARIDDIFGWSFIPNISGTYEFSKTVFFICWGQVLFIYFLITQKNIQVPKYIIPLLWVLIISTVFSLSPLTSLVGWVSKWHGMIFMYTLLCISIFLHNSSKTSLQSMLKWIIYSSPLICAWALFEYFSPSFDYGNLSNRAFGSFGHPNYLAGYILLLIPLLGLVSHTLKRVCLYALLVITLLLTKSAWAIVIVFCYWIWKIKKYMSKKQLLCIALIWWCIIAWVLYTFGLGVKVHSFLSRFFIWETTLSIIFSDIKIILFGTWLETLQLKFDLFKSEYLYIFENIWFRADRPHNIFLNIWQATGLLWIWTLAYLGDHFKKHIKKDIYCHSLLLFALFLIFNYASVIHWIIVWILFHLIVWKNIAYYRSKYVWRIIWSVVSVICIFTVSTLYIAEIYNKKSDHHLAIQHFPLPKYFYRIWEYDTGKHYESYASEEYYISRVVYDPDSSISCDMLVENYPTIENYFYCGEILEWEWFPSHAKIFYQTWLSLLPDMWNSESDYYNRFLIQNFFDGKRFFSERYSNISEILEKVKAQD